jgi:hypothetical protein
MTGSQKHSKLLGIDKCQHQASIHFPLTTQCNKMSLLNMLEITQEKEATLNVLAPAQICQSISSLPTLTHQEEDLTMSQDNPTLTHLPEQEWELCCSKISQLDHTPLSKSMDKPSNHHLLDQPISLLKLMESPHFHDK